MFGQWRALLAERADQAAASLASAPGALGVILGGSLGRGDP